MNSVNASAQTLPQAFHPAKLPESRNFSQFGGYSPNALIVESLLSNNPSNDAANTSGLRRGSAIRKTALGILEKLNALLRKTLPEGIESLKPEDNTPEKTARRIVDTVTSFYDTFAKQNPKRKGEELLDTFMNEIRKGVEAGYSDAYATLKGLGAFQLDGIQDGVEKTKALIDQYLRDFEESKRTTLSSSETSAQETREGVLTQAGGGLISRVA